MTSLTAKSELGRIVQYRNRGEELRLIAAELKHPDSRARVLETANSYLEMAEIVEESILCRRRPASPLHASLGVRAAANRRFGA